MDMLKILLSCAFPKYETKRPIFSTRCITLLVKKTWILCFWSSVVLWYFMKNKQLTFLKSMYFIDILMNWLNLILSLDSWTSSSINKQTIFFPTISFPKQTSSFPVHPAMLLSKKLWRNPCIFCHQSPFSSMHWKAAISRKQCLQGKNLIADTANKTFWIGSD